eukprot:s5014_g5.t1
MEYAVCRWKYVLLFRVFGLLNKVLEEWPQNPTTTADSQRPKPPAALFQMMRPIVGCKKWQQHTGHPHDPQDPLSILQHQLDFSSYRNFIMFQGMWLCYSMLCLPLRSPGFCTVDSSHSRNSRAMTSPTSGASAAAGVSVLADGRQVQEHVQVLEARSRPESAAGAWNPGTSPDIGCWK